MMVEEELSKIEPNHTTFDSGEIAFEEEKMAFQPRQFEAPPP
jgi:hypothetical protein